MPINQTTSYSNSVCPKDNSNESQNKTSLSIDFDYNVPRKAVIIQMEDIEKLQIQESNELIRAFPKCKRNSLKIFEMAVAAIDPKNPPEDNIVLLSKEAVFKFFNTNNRNKLANFKNGIKEIMSELIFDFSQGHDGSNGDLVPAFSRVKWLDDDGYLYIKFSNEIMPYITNLGEGGYTNYSLSDIEKLDSKYSLILYRWLVKNFNIYKKYENKSLKNPIIRVEDLRAVTGTLGLYSRFAHFEERVIKQPLEEINEKTNLNVNYEKIKHGRSVRNIQFFISEKPKPKANNEKLSKRKSKEERENERIMNAGKAIASEYTVMLSNAMLIDTFELRDFKLLARLQEEVYTKYDNIVKQYGMKSLENHIQQVSVRRMAAGTDVNDIVSYLKTILQNELDKGTFK